MKIFRVEDEGCEFCDYHECSSNSFSEDIYSVDDEGIKKRFCKKHFEEWKEYKAKSAFFRKEN